MSGDVLLVRTLRGIWPSLPVLLGASAAICAAAVVPVLVAPGINPVALLVTAVAVAPFLTALAVTVNEIVRTGEASARTWWRALRELSLFGIRSALVPAGFGVLFLGALEVWARQHHAWVLLSLALTGGATVLATLGLLAVLPMGAAHPRLRGPALWLTGLHLVARRPVRFVAALSVVGVGLWAATAWSASLLLLVPAPAAIVAVVAVWTSASDTRPKPRDLELSSATRR